MSEQRNREILAEELRKEGLIGQADMVLSGDLVCLSIIRSALTAMSRLTAERDAVIEECAKLCDGEENVRIEQGDWQALYKARVARKLADAIRALKQSTIPQQTEEK